MLRRPSELDQAIKADDIPSGIRLIPRKLEIHPGERWLIKGGDSKEILRQVNLPQNDMKLSF